MTDHPKPSPFSEHHSEGMEILDAVADALNVMDGIAVFKGVRADVVVDAPAGMFADGRRIKVTVETVAPDRSPASIRDAAPSESRKRVNMAETATTAPTSVPKAGSRRND